MEKEKVPVKGEEPQSKKKDPRRLVLKEKVIIKANAIVK